MSNAVQMVRGARRQFTITVRDQNNALVDLTGATPYFTVAKKLDATTTEIDLNGTGDPTQCFLLTQAGATLGQYRVILLPADTNSLKSQLYRYDSWVEFSATDRQPVICDEDFDLKGSVTQFP